MKRKKCSIHEILGVLRASEALVFVIGWEDSIFLRSPFEVSGLLKFVRL